MNRKQTPIVLHDYYQLHKFTNEEYYYIISSLLCLGDAGFAREKLYLSFDPSDGNGPENVRFLFITEQALYSRDQEPKTEFHLGQIDNTLDNIEVYSSICDASSLDLTLQSNDTGFIIKQLKENPTNKMFRPKTFLEGIHRITSGCDFDGRKDNELLMLPGCSSTGEITYGFDFGKVGPMGTDFSGHYFLIAEPVEENHRDTRINSFFLINEKPGFDEYETYMKVQYLNLESVQRYESSESGSLLKEQVETALRITAR